MKIKDYLASDRSIPFSDLMRHLIFAAWFAFVGLLGLGVIHP